MELCLVLQEEAVFQWKLASDSKKLTVTKEFLDSNILLPTFPSSGKWDFQVAYSLLASVNFEPCNFSHFCIKTYIATLIRTAM